MFNTIAGNFVNILIPVVVFIIIGRVLAQRKHKTPEAEDDDSDAHGYSAPKTEPSAAPVKYASPKNSAEGLYSFGDGNLTVGNLSDFSVGSTSDRTGFPAVPQVPVQRSFFTKLDHMSVYRKAFVFSEILGPPKGLRQD